MATAARHILPTALAAALVAVALSGCSLQQLGSLVSSSVQDDGGATESSEDTSVQGDAGSDTGSSDMSGLAVGDCVDDTTLVDSSPSVTTASDEAPDADTVPCAQPHYLEVYRNVTLQGTRRFPGEDAVDAQSEKLCTEAFAAFVGHDYDDSVYDFVYYAPTEETWDMGDRTVNCLIGDPARKTVGSLAGVGH
jgi:hypothetical protein